MRAIVERSGRTRLVPRPRCVRRWRTSSGARGRPGSRTATHVVRTPARLPRSLACSTRRAPADLARLGAGVRAAGGGAGEVGGGARRPLAARMTRWPRDADDPSLRRGPTSPAVRRIERRRSRDPWTLRVASRRSLALRRGCSFSWPTGRGARAGMPRPACWAMLWRWCVVDEAEIANLAVAPDARRRGSARAARARARRAARDGGARTSISRCASRTRPRERCTRRDGLRGGRAAAGYYRSPVEDALVLRCARSVRR